MEYNAGKYDVAVIGAGHAGAEAASACARLGVSTVLFTLSLDTIANMPCNPSIGGTGKGHLVREIDALGGEMAKAADATFLQSRMLNRGKGPAVHSLRVQSDRMQYHAYMKQRLENIAGLDIKQGEITQLRVDESGSICAVVTSLGAVYEVTAAIVCCGTYLKAVIHVGDSTYSGGPDGIKAPQSFSESLEKLGVRLLRFKTGTPARVHKSSIDFSVLEEQRGDERVIPMSFSTGGELINRAVCHIAYTNDETHRVIRENLHRSPLYSGRIEGIGARYCPSIEDKVVRFADKERHQTFVEPLGLDTQEMYLQGLSSSLPEDVQLVMYRTIKGFENIRIMRNAYAIEYDCADPTQLLPSLEFKDIPGLFGAGQFNGTSGYEEAAAQGLAAGINAARRIKGLAPVIFERSGSYIGTLIDDIVTKGCLDPYRMMTARSEYRLLLRQDNADERLTPLGREIGLVDDESYGRFCIKMRQKEDELARLKALSLPPSEELNRMLEEKGTSPLSAGIRAAELLRRPQVSWDDLAAFDPYRTDIPRSVVETVEIEIKYDGYISRQLSQARQMKRLEERAIPADMDYAKVTGLRLEAREKLSRMRPVNIGQASRISGVNPADINVLLIYMSAKRGNGNGA